MVPVVDAVAPLLVTSEVMVVNGMFNPSSALFNDLRSELLGQLNIGFEAATGSAYTCTYYPPIQVHHLR